MAYIDYILLKLILLITAILLIQPACADVVELHISPENPVAGDTITISGTASPNEKIKFVVSYTKTLTPSERKYKYHIDGIKIPNGPNRFTVRTQDVENLNVRVKILIWWTKSEDASGGIATVSQSNIPPGTYKAQIDGTSATGISAVMLKVTGEHTIDADSSGNFKYSYDTDALPADNFELTVNGLVRTITLRDTHDEYFMKISINNSENVTFANPISAADGNWIKLSGGTKVILPSLTFIYNGINATTYTSNNRVINIDINVESHKDYEVEYPYSTHPMYVNESGKNEVNISFNGSLHFADENVDIHLIKTTPTLLKDAFNSILKGNTTDFRNLLNGSINKSLNCSLDSEADINISFGQIEAGDYVVFVLLNSSNLPNAADLSILSATTFQVLEYASEISASSTAYTNDTIPVSITINASNDDDYIYGAVLVHSDVYRAALKLQCNGTRNQTNLTVNEAYLVQGYNIAGVGLSNVNRTTIQNMIEETIIGTNNGTVSFKEASTNSTSISLSTNDLNAGKYFLITGVYKSGEKLVAFNQNEIEIVQRDETTDSTLASLS